MTNPIPHLFLVLPLTFIATQHCKSEAGGALKKAVWGKFCEISEDLGKTPAGATAKLSSIDKLRSRLEETALRLQIYAQQTENLRDSAKAATLATYFAGLANSATSQATGGEGQKLIKASADAAYAKGRLDELLSLMAQAKGASHGCLVDDSKQAQAAPKDEKIGSMQCSLKLKHGAGTYIRPKTLATNGFKSDAVPASKGNEGQEDGKKCAILKLNGGGLGHGEAVDAEEVSYGGGIFTGSRTDNKLTGATLSTIKAKQGEAANIWSAAHDALTTIDTLDTEKFTNDALGDEPTDEVIRATALVMGSEGSTEKEEGTMKAKNMFPNPAHEEIKKFIMKMEAHKLTKGELGMAENTPLGQIGGVEKLTALLVRTALALSKQKQELIAELTKKNAEKNAKIEEEKEKECNAAGNEQEACEKLNDKGCVFNKDGEKDKKCTLKKETKEKLEKEIKETTEYGKENITGNNSFVINKALLWLAVLLF
uniref:Variant surface glycoprotein 3.1 n=1 Tax=Trypanosoma brucei gambiense TaxID=31285 RepID=M4N7P1_TRYBG|nr:variant surface glycoprotein 3.1 [Trypanosoma brucei gambiense]